MELHTISNLPDDFNLFCVGDIHKGSIFSFDEGVDEIQDIITSKYDGLPASKNYAVLHGDMIEGYHIDAFQYNPVTTSMPFPNLQKDKTIDKWKPLKKHIIGSLTGNHERYLWKFGDIGKEIAEKIGVPYGGYTCKWTYLDKSGKLLFKHYSTHGKKGINSCADDPLRVLSNMRLSLKRHLRNKAGDCVLQTRGHTHKLLYAKPTSELYLTSTTTKIKQNYTTAPHTASYIHPDLRWYGSTGSFYKMHEPGMVTGPDKASHVAISYSELAEYDPVELGSLVFLIRNREIVDARKVIVGS